MKTYKNDKGRDIRISYSAFDTWQRCRRKWWYAYKERREQKPNKNAILGSQVHDQLEHYGKHGEWKAPKEEHSQSVNVPQAIAKAALPYIPTAQPGEGFGEEWLVEAEVKMQCGPLPFVGYVDLANVSDPLDIQVDDYKTTSSPEFRWSKTPETLRKNHQPAGYTYALVHTLGMDPPETVTWRHINICTKPSSYGPEGPTFYAMETVAEDVEWSEVVALWQEMEVAASEMVDYLEKYTGPEEVPANTYACRDFGGCPFAEFCPASPQNRDDPELTTTTLDGPAPKGDPMTTSKQAALRAQLFGGKQPTQTETKPKPKPTPTPKPEAPAAGDAAPLAALVRSSLDAGTPLPAAAVQQMAKAQGVDFEDFLAHGFTVEAGMVQVLNVKNPEPEAPTTAQKEEEDDLLSPGAIKDMMSGLKQRHWSLLQAASDGEDVTGKPGSPLLMSLGLVTAEGLTDKGDQLAEAAGLYDDDDDGSTPQSDEDDDGVDDGEGEPEQGQTFDDVATQAVLDYLTEAEAEGKDRVKRTTINSRVLAADDSAQRVRIERVRNILDEAGLSDKWAAKGKYVYIKEAAGEIKGRPKPAPKPEETKPKGREPLFIPAGRAKEFMSEFGWGTSEVTVKAWAEENGFALDRALNTWGGKLRHGMLVEEDFLGGAREAFLKYRPDYAPQLQAMDKAEEQAAEPEVTEPEAPAPAPTKAPEQAPVKVDTVQAPEEIPLFVDVVALDRVPPMPFHAWIAPYEAEVEARGGKVNGKFKQPLDYWGEMDYAQGPKAVAALILADLHEKGVAILPPQGLAIPSRHPLADTVLPLLQRLGDVATYIAAR